MMLYLKAMMHEKENLLVEDLDIYGKENPLERQVWKSSV